MGIDVTGSLDFESNSKYPKAAQKEIAVPAETTGAHGKRPPRAGSNSLNFEAMR
jgi:hypothetical protein